MALNAYMKVTGETQGEIQGETTQKGRENLIMLDEVRHEIVSPRDAASGLPTGKRQHKPFVVVGEMGKHSPLLLLALTNNEVLTNVKVDFWRPHSSGKEVMYYTVELTNASVAWIRNYMQNVRDPRYRQFLHYEEIGFAYQKIVWNSLTGGTTAEDDWESPVA